MTASSPVARPATRIARSAGPPPEESARPPDARWSPLLLGESQRRARAAAAAIAVDLVDWPFPCSPSISPRAPGGAWSLGLPAGRAGRALFYAYLGRADPSPRWPRRARRLLI